MPTWGTQRDDPRERFMQSSVCNRTQLRALGLGLRRKLTRGGGGRVAIGTRACGAGRYKSCVGPKQARRAVELEGAGRPAGENDASRHRQYKNGTNEKESSSSFRGEGAIKKGNDRLEHATHPRHGSNSSTQGEIEKKGLHAIHDLERGGPVPCTSFTSS